MRELGENVILHTAAVASRETLLIPIPTPPTTPTQNSILDIAASVPHEPLSLTASAPVQNIVFHVVRDANGTLWRLRRRLHRASVNKSMLLMITTVHLFAGGVDLQFSARS